MKIILGIILFCPVVIHAQSFKIGFNFDTQLIIMKNNDNSLTLHELYPFPPQAVHFDLIYVPIQKILLQLKIGGDFNIPDQKFMGWEFGIKGNYEFYNPLYLTAGVLEHSNEGGELGMEAGTFYASIFMINAGIGVNLTKVFSIEVNYYLPVSKKKIYSQYYYYDDNASWELFRLKNMIRLSFAFGWEI